MKTFKYVDMLYYNYKKVFQMKNQNSQNEENKHNDMYEIYHTHEDTIERAKKNILADKKYNKNI